MILFLSFPRSAGTLLNKILGIHQDIVIFSEIDLNGKSSQSNFKRSFFKDFLYQAWKWYGLISFWEFLVFHKNSHEKNLKIIEKRINRKNKVMVLREWAWKDYEENKEPINFYKKILKNNNKVLIFERNKEDLKNSFEKIFLSKLEDKQKLKELGKWEKIFSKFKTDVEILSPDKCFSYEDFLRNQKKVFKEICDYIGISYDKKCLVEFYKFDKYLGDPIHINKKEISPTK